ncbi:MAG: aldehyde dehydrogenase family protein [Planctomycetaceae bacterium]
MGSAILGAKTEPSGVRLRLLAEERVNETPSRSDAGNEAADPQASSATGFTAVETDLCTTPVSIVDAISVVQKPVNHRDKPGGEKDIAGLNADTVRSQLRNARTSQPDWAAVPLQNRLKILKKFRLLIAAAPRALANKVGRANLAESLAAEVLPLLDACRFLETEASRILKDKTVGQRGRPMWLWGNSVVLRPEPLGVVLIIGPSNYPLMLPGIQILQAIAAGNGVLIKPAEHCSDAMRTLVSMAVSAGLPEGLIQVLPECSEAATDAIRIGVDKVFLTGSAPTGRAVSRELAESATPSVMELSGCDAVFVLDDADLNLVSDCLLFGLTLNNSQTCMAPRRIFANNHQADEILRLLKLTLETRTSVSDRQTTSSQRAICFAAMKIQEAISSGAKLVCGSVIKTSPTELSGVAILDHVTSDMAITQADIFAPVLSLIRVESSEQALRENSKCQYALSATVFGSPARCQQFARLIPAGCVVINDMIVPTADPRVPFGGRGISGHGTTRGEAGLLEMTQLKAIVATRRWFKPHLQSPTAADADVMEQLIRLEHATHPLQSLMAVPKMIKATMEQMKIRRSQRRKVTK